MVMLFLSPRDRLSPFLQLAILEYKEEQEQKFSFSKYHRNALKQKMYGNH